MLSLAFLALAACGERDAGQAGPVDKVLDATVPNAEQTVEPDNGVAVPSGASRPDKTSAADGPIPVSARGRWAGLSENCGDEASSLALTVTPDRLLFHESEGVARTVEPAEGGVAVQADFTGEGESWSRRILLRPSADGSRLTVINDGADVARKRCGAA
jgi:hypothetical protein